MWSRNRRMNSSASIVITLGRLPSFVSGGREGAVSTEPVGANPTRVDGGEQRPTRIRAGRYGG